MSKILDDYLRDVRRNLSHLPVRERDAVMAEMRDHLVTEARRLRHGDSGLSDDEAMLQATQAFGEPEEIGVAHGPRGGVVRRSTGEHLLDVAILTSRAAGRGAKGVLKWGCAQPCRGRPLVLALFRLHVPLWRGHAGWGAAVSGYV